MADIIKFSQVPSYWTRRLPFDCNGTLRAVVIETGKYQANRLVADFDRFRVTGNEDDNPFGKLPMDWGRKLTQALDPGDNAQVYVVYSYDTPIAWLDRGEEVRPSVKYSASTSKHLGKLYKV